MTSKVHKRKRGAAASQDVASEQKTGAVERPDSSSHQNRKCDRSNERPDRMQRLFGFELSDLSSWSRFVQLLHRPSDPASLAFFRIGFGFLMALDIPQERGLGHADFRWGDPDECRFPLFNFMSPLPLAWMYVVYLVMWTGAMGIMLGLLFRLSCILFLVPYWYVFLLDKTSWNNHSYLYGLSSIILLFSNANRYASLDGFIWPKIRNSHVPLWNVAIIRLQLFLVYFLAGLKKLDADWVHGYSMNDLSKHWVFEPFTYILTYEQIDMLIVHWGGLFIDMFSGYMLFFDATRWLGYLIAGSFHALNSQIFSIGMFSYVMLGSIPIFSACDWPKRVIHHLPLCVKQRMPSTDSPQNNDHCIYSTENIKQFAKTSPSQIAPSDRIQWKHHISTTLIIGWVAVQCFLPYSHFITKGYNNWTQGLYGYSWDMMVHSWTTQHVRITYVDNDTGNVGYINPDAYSRGTRRWNSHADMVKQYATCVKDRLESHNLHNVSLYFDIWRSLNDRFQQRMFDPRVDMVSAPWHPFQETPWLLPLLTDLSDWRHRLDQIESNIYNQTNDTDVVFIADFPGLSLENYVQEDFTVTELLVLKGELIVELVDQSKNFTLSENQSMNVPAGQYHNVHTVSSTPSCYMYKFINTTERELIQNITKYEKLQGEQASSSQKQDSHPGAIPDNPDLRQKYEQVLKEKADLMAKANQTVWQRFSEFVTKKYTGFVRSASMTHVALRSIITGETFVEAFNATIGFGDELDSTEDMVLETS